MRYVFLFLLFICTTSLFAQNDTKKIIFGSDYDYPPYEFINKKGEYDGFHIDLIRAIGKEIGYEVEIQLGEWTYIREELENTKGRINVSDMIYSKGRAKKVDFLPHHAIVSYVMVRNKHYPAVHSLEELSAKNEKIAVSRNTIADEFVKTQDSTIQKVYAVTALHALKLVEAKQSNYALINQYSAHKFIEEQEFDNLAVSEKIFFSEKLSFVVKKGNTKLANDIEEGIHRLKENGTYSELYIKWFDNEKDSYTKLVKQLQWISFVLLILILSIGTWIWTLKKQVQRKTQNLQLEIEEREKMQKLLFDKNKELEKRNYELDKFVYSVSHNVRSPIASALGLVNVIQLEFEENTNLSFYVSNIGKSLHKLDYYVNKILAYVANKNFKVKKERIYFDGLITQLIEEAKFLEGANEVRFDKQIIQEIDFYSDTERLYTILECLIANSVEYRAKREEESFIKISVRVTRMYASINIEDNSEGIQEEQVDKVFEMFYRGNQRSKGTGLGLYVVKQTLEQLSGTLQLQSNPKKGSIFTLQIPNLGMQENLTT